MALATLLLLAAANVVNLTEWRFEFLGNSAGEAARPAQMVRVPHDWAIHYAFDPKRYPAGEGALPYYGKGVYTKEIDAATDSWLEFDGVMSHATVKIDGQVKARRAYGYSSFRVAVAKGRHTVEVTAEPKVSSSRWYPGAGIFRPVRLVERVKDEILPEDVAITFPKITADEARVRFSYPNGERLITIKKPRFWSPEDPYLYSYELGGRVYRYGIRTLEFDPTKGFFLNGKHRQMRGVCMHHDLGALGAAFETTAARRQLRILKEMGCDAIRTSHNPPAPGLLDLCDELGFMVMDESFDCWRERQREHDYWRDFDAWHVRDQSDLVRRDRNHACVVMWSVGNEVPEHARPQLLAQGTAIAAELAGIVRVNDPQQRPITTGNYKRDTLWNGFAEGLDVFGANYLAEYYDFYTDNHSRVRKGIVGTETCSTVSSRGEYAFPVLESADMVKRSTEDLPKMVRNGQVSGYDLWGPHSNDYPPDFEFAQQDKYPFVYGDFVWTGFDYLGEPDPCRRLEHPGRSAYFGIFDLCGFPKDRYWIYRSQWRPELKTAHILPHWNWPGREGEITPVHVYTSGDEGELFVNGVSQGRKRRGRYEYRLRWDEVRYQPGEVVVKTWKRGEPWAEDRVVTAGEAAKLVVTAENPKEDLVYVRIEVRDAKGNFVPRANNRLNFKVEGEFAIEGVCNGDPTDYESLKGTTLKCFNGLCQVIVRRLGDGQGALIVESEGLKTVRLGLDAARASEPRAGSLVRSVTMLPGEEWWGLCNNFGRDMPFTEKSDFSCDLRLDNYSHQSLSFLASTKGRAIWCPEPVGVVIKDGKLRLECDRGEITLVENAGKNLAEAYRYGSKTWFPPTGEEPELLYFSAPQYNTWIELTYHQNEKDILAYAQSMLDHGLPPGVFMIDDTWQYGYGTWEFDPRRFQNPKGMMDRLHQMGFKVLLWMAPFVSMDTPEYRRIQFAKNPDDVKGWPTIGGFLTSSRSPGWGGQPNPAPITWWNGISALLDFTHPNAVAWFTEQLDRLQRDYGADGFKFDGGGVQYYKAFAHDPTATPCQQSALYGQFALKYKGSEYRNVFGFAGKPVIMRLHDKDHSWAAVQRLIPDMLAAGFVGCPFICPDMVGGGSWSAFLPGAPFSQEIFIRSAQVQALCPMMQLSASPWRYLDAEHQRIFKKAVELRQRFAPQFVEMAKRAAKDGEPIMRNLEYVFPGQGYGAILDQFMMGDDLMVAPVVEGGVKSRKVVIPPGKWMADDGSVYEGPRTIEVVAPLERLPHFVRK